MARDALRRGETCEVVPRGFRRRLTLLERRLRRGVVPRGECRLTLRDGAGGVLVLRGVRALRAGLVLVHHGAELGVDLRNLEPALLRESAVVGGADERHGLEGGEVAQLARQNATNGDTSGSAGAGGAFAATTATRLARAPDSGGGARARRH